MLALAMTLQTIVPAALASARLAERIALATLGLADAVDCHSGGSTTKNMPGQRPPHDTNCECCLTGCGGTGPSSLPSDKGAISRPLFAANAATRLSHQVALLRSYLTERTRLPRSPPVLA